MRAILADELVGVYATGSFALGDFDAGRSDLDVAAVCRRRLQKATKLGVVLALRHEALPCPARKLELVLYREDVARVPSVEAGFELNLNTGSGVEDRTDLEPGDVEPHWFPIDRAILAEHGVALLGPPAAELFAPIARELLLPPVRESLRWHLQPGNSDDGDAVLNACRALRYVVEGRWSSKGEAGSWALEHTEDRGIVEEALRLRTGARLDRSRVERFVAAVLAAAESGRSAIRR